MLIPKVIEILEVTLRHSLPDDCHGGCGLDCFGCQIRDLLARLKSLERPPLHSYVPPFHANAIGNVVWDSEDYPICQDCDAGEVIAFSLNVLYGEGPGEVEPDTIVIDPRGESSLLAWGAHLMQKETGKD